MRISAQNLFGLICVGILGAACSANPSVSQTASSVPATVEPAATPRPYRLRGGDLVIGADFDDIPAIFADESLFVGVTDGNLEFFDEEPVVGVMIEDQAKAYPIRILSFHEIVNDTVGGQPLIVTWCPLCYTSIVFSRVVDRELTFGVSGYLLHNNLVMYDHQTETLWSQVLGEAVRGAYWRTRLEVLPSVMTTWGDWKNTYPETLVLSAIQMGKEIEDLVDPYVGYYLSGAAGFGGQESLDERLPTKSLVIGVQVGKLQRAYPFDTIREEGIINDQIDSFPLVLVYNDALNTIFVFDRRNLGLELNFVSDSQSGQMRDMETDSIWDSKLGQALSGELEGSLLSPANAQLVFWFAWSDFFPNTEIFTP